MMDGTTTLHRAMVRLAIAAAIVALPGAVIAQSSSGYKLQEHALDAGGRPVDAVVSTSASFKLTLDSIGDSVARRGVSAPSFHLDGGMAQAYPPPGEVENLEILADTQTLAWSFEPASTSYNVYTGALSALPGGYGGCAISNAGGPFWIDSTTPAPGAGFFYLVTGENRLGEEGTKGRDSGGALRGNASPCP